MASIRVVFTFTARQSEQARTFHKKKAKERIKKTKATKEPILNAACQPQKTPRKIYSHAWESDDWSPSQWPDDSWTPAAWWSSTRAHTAWKAVPSLNLAYHPTTRSSGSGLHTIDWIEMSNRKISETFLLLWKNDISLPLQLQQILCFRKLRNRNLLEKLHCSHSNNTTVFYQDWCAREKWCTFFVSASLRWKTWVRLLDWILKETKLYVQLIVCILLQLSTPQLDILCWNESCVSGHDQVAWGNLVTRRDM